MGCKSIIKLLKTDIFGINLLPYNKITTRTEILTYLFAFKADGQSYMDLMLQSVKDDFTFERVKAINGYFMCYIILNTLLIQVPILVALVAADSISGEANMGTLRLMLSKPISRSQIIIVKFIAATIYTLMLLVWLAILALFGSMLLFGTDDMFLLKTSYVVLLKESDVFWRYIGAFGFAALAMTTVASLGFFLSVFVTTSGYIP